MFKQVDPVPNFSEIEEKIIVFWKKNKIFEKSIENRPKDNLYSFYDGPPFITGLPHYGTLLPSIAKDVIPRYQTMKGKRVRRVWGWDCHGLPAENQVEKALGIKSKKEIENLGIGKFIAECRNYVSTVSGEWEWYIDHIGRWVDFKNAYKTMDLTYMETVLWVFKELYKKGLIYKGKRVSLFCPRCSTPISNFEVAMDSSYKDLEDPSIIVKFKIKEGNLKGSFLLAWTTTPWTLPGNLALAVLPDADYLLIENKNHEKYILAKERVDQIFKEEKYQILKEFKGKNLEGLTYEPLYQFSKANKNDYQVYTAAFVSLEEGTGIVHIAPGFGEEDTALGEKQKLSLVDHIDEEGKFISGFSNLSGLFFKKANPLIIEELTKAKLIFREGKIVHSYPVCHRCETVLLYKSQTAWYLSVSKIRDKMLQLNEKINWVPEFFKHGRFELGIKNAPDWCISRSRYWGTPIPIWECDCGERFVIGSVQELEKLSGKKIADLHKPEIDQIYIKCNQCGQKAKRVKEVLDCWFESGSVPYGQFHYPFENREEFEKSFPTDFIAEYTGQLRGWFYVLHVISTGLMESVAFKNVLVTGVILGTDGRKMSKSLGNYPDPKLMLKKYGGDALRLYFLGSVVMDGKDILISEEEYREQIKGTMFLLWNVYRYFLIQVELNQWTSKPTHQKLSVLDKWLLARLDFLVYAVTRSLDGFNTIKAVEEIKKFIKDLSTWYVRRSRQRNDSETVLSVLYQTIICLSKIMAPLTPFLAEEIFKNITDQESVHLADWPESVKSFKPETKLFEEMDFVKEICELGHAERKSLKIKVRQPLSKLKVKSEKLKIENEYEELIKEELNVKSIEWVKEQGNLAVELDSKVTPVLRAEGEAREVIRQIQIARKESGCSLDQKIKVVLPQWPEKFAAEIKRQTLAIELIKGSKLEIIR